MNRASLLVLASAAFLSSCTDNAVTGPFTFSGSCDVFDFLDTTLETDPLGVRRLEVTADCDMGSEIGMTGTIFDFVITSNSNDNTLLISGQSFYSTSQTDILVGEFEGTGTTVSQTTFNFEGAEVYGGGVGDFENTTGSSEISGGVITITAPGSGGWTVVGQID
jgi:hypothetical protein